MSSGYAGSPELGCQFLKFCNFQKDSIIVLTGAGKLSCRLMQ